MQAEPPPNYLAASVDLDRAFDYSAKFKGDMSAMRLSILATTVLAVSMFASCAGQNSVASGVEAKVTKIERAKQITVGSASATARAGYDLARVMFELKASGGVKELKLSSDEQELIDANGKSYKSNADLSFNFGTGGGTMSMDSMFEVPENASLKTFKLGKASFDLSGIDGAKPTK